MRKMIMLVLALFLASAPTLARQPADALLPEFLAGTLAGYAGGAIGAYALSWAFSAGATGWDALARAILGAFVGFSGGTILGASLGVIGAGSLLGIEGNVGLCFLGAAAGTGVVMGVGIAFSIAETTLPLAPPIAAAAATAGFNVGARSRR